MLLGARIYDPTAARFTTPDTFVAAELDVAIGTDDLTGNRYLFAASNPVAYYEDGHAPCWRNGKRECGRLARQGARNVINSPISRPAEFVARLSGASCETDQLRQIRVCTNARFGYARGGTMRGSVYVTGEPYVDDRLRRHEAKHANQWAIMGTAYPVLYAAAEFEARVLRRRLNRFEEQAGARDGCYKPDRNGRYRASCPRG